MSQHEKSHHDTHVIHEGRAFTKQAGLFLPIHLKNDSEDKALKRTEVTEEEILDTGAAMFLGGDSAMQHDDIEKIKDRGGSHEVYPKTTHEIQAWPGVKVGRWRDDEFTLHGAVELTPGHDDGVKLAIISMPNGFVPMSDGRGYVRKYGPFDLDGSGRKQYFNEKCLLIRETIENGVHVVRTFPFNEQEESISLGRNSEAAKALGYAHHPYVQDHHAEIGFDQNGNNYVDPMLFVDDYDAPQGINLVQATKFFHMKPLQGKIGNPFTYTDRVKEMLHIEYDGNDIDWGHGKYEGRPVIARDTPINGGVYPVGGDHGEALVIDDEKYPKELDSVYENILRRIQTVKSENISVRGLRRKGSHVSAQHSEKILQEVFSGVYDTLAYDLEMTEAIARDYKKVTLNKYIHEGVGVCRTQATLAAYLLERLIKNGYLQGRASIDRNYDEDTLDGHAWARYTNKAGEVYIIDPAQRYVGKLSDVKSDSQWDYRRSEDILREILA